MQVAAYQALAVRLASTIHIGEYTVDFAGRIHPLRNQPWSDQELREIYQASLVRLGRNPPPVERIKDVG